MCLDPTTGNTDLRVCACFHSMGKSEMYMYVGKDEVEYYNVHQHIYHASNVVLHEHFNRTTSENDIALVKTSTRITFNNNVGALCFPNASFRLHDDKKCLFAGYGDTQGELFVVCLFIFVKKIFCLLLRVLWLTF